MNHTNPLAYVISANLQRRHLSESQRAMVAAKLANLPDGVRKDRSANLRTLSVSQPEAAKLLNVSVRSVQSAKALLVAAPDLWRGADTPPAHDQGQAGTNGQAPPGDAAQAKPGTTIGIVVRDVPETCRKISGKFFFRRHRGHRGGRCAGNSRKNFPRVSSEDKLE